MIVVEGMDNTGKSTLVESLTGKFGLKYYKSPGPDVGRAYQMRWVEERIGDSDNNIIFDRFPLISEEIYGTHLRGYSNFEKEVDLYKNFKERGPLIIYCRPPMEEVISFKDGREQMEGVVENSIQLLLMYDQWFTEKIVERAWNLTSYNYLSKDDKFRVINYVNYYLSQQ